MSPKNYFFWWVERAAGGQWFGWRLLADDEVWRLEEDIRRGTSGVRQLYRWIWTGSEWQYDDRSAISMYYAAGEQRMAYFP